MHLFDTLSKYQKGVNFLRSEDYLFYTKNRHLFLNIPMYRYLADTNEEFDIIRANIVIHSLLNKAQIEKAIIYAYKNSNMTTEDANNYVMSQLSDMPYIKQGANKIYIPIFSHGINTFYTSQFGKLLKEPYSKLIDHYESSCIDPFEMYNFSLFSSLFTKLVKVYADEDILIMYHFDFHALYVINNQGRLDAKIAFFDKYLKHPNYEHMMERIEPVVRAYVNDDKEKFYLALIEQRLVSKKLVYRIKHGDFSHKRKLERKAR